ncbi:hypothetical protein CDO44_03335 [Pigmentiphaga sp. NML080357]|uniref:hypothetical protein n=1 Tax=Pigmentiphaga sp. NML080357 TaxID=2008675 RepID=UPI000B41E5B3|nr:hypothetical protein [Pigmentiphaga sp. NML080357]OVZ63705.1 hypothetical protein CDO44_03335 [Pigmentiphaga sp. NML080357]
MKNILQYMRQLRQRRLAAFELSLTDANSNDPYDGELRQLALNYGHSPEVDARALRRRLAELEYDDEV